MDETKIIVTHRGALEAKYGAAITRVMKAVDALVSADAGRGIGSRLVALDDRGDMAPFGVQPMGGPADRKGAKDAVDAIDLALRPHYILILGAWDVVPMQLLENEMGIARPLGFRRPRPFRAERPAVRVRRAVLAEAGRFPGAHARRRAASRHSLRAHARLPREAAEERGARAVASARGLRALARPVRRVLEALEHPHGEAGVR